MAAVQASSHPAARGDRVKGIRNRTSSVRMRTQWLKALGTNLHNFLIATWLDWIMLAKVGAIAAAVNRPQH